MFLYLFSLLIYHGVYVMWAFASISIEWYRWTIFSFPCSPSSCQCCSSGSHHVICIAPNVVVCAVFGAGTVLQFMLLFWFFAAFAFPLVCSLCSVSCSSCMLLSGPLWFWVFLGLFSSSSCIFRLWRSVPAMCVHALSWSGACGFSMGFGVYGASFPALFFL